MHATLSLLVGDGMNVAVFSRQIEHAVCDIFLGVQVYYSCISKREHGSQFPSLPAMDSLLRSRAYTSEALQMHPAIASALSRSDKYYIAGGAALGLVLGRLDPASDIDVFTVSGEDCADMQRETIRTILRELLSDNLRVSVKCTSFAVTINIVKDGDPFRIAPVSLQGGAAGVINEIVNNNNTRYNGMIYRPVQFIGRRYPDIQTLFSGFDLQPCEVAYNVASGETVMTSRAEDAIRTRTIDLTQVRPMHDFDRRLRKYSVERGFRVTGSLPEGLHQAPYNSEVVYMDDITSENLETVLAEVNRTISGVSV